MSLSVWTQTSGYSFGSHFAEQTLNIALPVTNDAGVTYQVISGALPDNVFLIGNRLIGTPFVLKNQLNYNFCIRASSSAGISDRTFQITIVEPNIPTFITPPDNLDIGVNHQFYVLDSTYVNYQLEAYDLNASGQPLNYFIASNDGNLPPGLTLSSTGLISGFIQPILSLTPQDGTGDYDNGSFDGVGYDFGLRSTDGFDDYTYDTVFFDFNVPTQNIVSLNANYQFRVTITDGIAYSQRIFRIFVVGNDEFRADSTTRNGLADEFTADATYIRQPYWITDPNLGTYRANNYIVIPIALYDNKQVIFRLETTNQEVYASTLQISQTDNNINSNTLTVTNVRGTPAIGQYFSLEYYVPGATDAVYQISLVTDLGNNTYRLTLTSDLLITVPNGLPLYIGSLGVLPGTEYNIPNIGLQFDPITGDVYGTVPYQPAVTKKYTFTITATRLGTKEDTTSNSRTFTINILGDVNSEINWNTSGNLGAIPANYTCTLAVVATSTVPNAQVIYEQTAGQLPEGLTLNPDGEITGMPNQFYNLETGELGLTTFYDTDVDNVHYTNQTFDHGTTSIDRVYTFTVQASDQFGYSAVEKDFTVTITTPNTVPFSNIVTRPFLTSSQRTIWQNFINNTTIFTPTSIYRPSDSNFGIQSSLTVLVYAGIQTEAAAAYVGAMGLNVKRKRFQFGGVKKAVAIDPNTNEPVYEAVYVQMIDPLEPNGKHLPLSVKTNSSAPEAITVDDSNSIWSVNLSDLTADGQNATRPLYNVTADSTGYQISNPNTDTYYPNSITNWQTRLSGVGLSERNYLPLWMRSIPSGSKAQLGYVLALPLCFCKPGTADDIITNIKFNGFDFKVIDYTIDRFIINAVTGNINDKYLVFRNDRITV